MGSLADTRGPFMQGEVGNPRGNADAEDETTLAGVEGGGAAEAEPDVPVATVFARGGVADEV